MINKKDKKAELKERNIKFTGNASSKDIPLKRPQEGVGEVLDLVLVANSHKY